MNHRLSACMPRAPFLNHSCPPTIAVLGVCLLACLRAVAADAQELAQLVQRLDRVRLPAQSLAMRVRISQAEGRGGVPELAEHQVFTRVAEGTISTLLICRQPAKDADKRLLFIGEACWFHDPRAKRPTRIAIGQMWSQPLAFDSSAWRLAADFSATVAGREAVRGGDGRVHECSMIDFVPKNRTSAAPARMRYWLEDSGRYWQVVHYTRSGRVFRTIDEIRYATGPGGVERVVRMRVRCGFDEAEVNFTDLVARELPAGWFDPAQLPGVQP